jgi:hypothetical protein
LTVLEAIETLEGFGCVVRIEGDRLKVRGPNRPEVAALVSDLRARREEALRIARERGSGPPTPKELEESLPPGVRVIRYAPKTPPVAVAPVSVVTDVGKFIRAYVEDLKFRLEHPETYACARLDEILAKLADVGVELATKGAIWISSVRWLGEALMPEGLCYPIRNA